VYDKADLARCMIRRKCNIGNTLIDLHCTFILTANSLVDEPVGD